MGDLESPGAVVRKAMEAKGWTQSDLAYALGKTTAAINQILNDKRSISNDMALALGKALELPPEVFARAQADWDIRNAAPAAPDIEARSRILSKYPLREMVRRGWINPDDGMSSVSEQVCRFFEVSSLEEVPHLAHAAKKTNYDEVPPIQLAWLFRVRQIASEMVAPQYDREKLVSAIEGFSELRSDPQGVRFVPRLLNAAGVRFVIVEGLPGSKIDGVCFWNDKHSPVIGMSMRFDRIDNFWFVLRHECAHVLHGHGKAAAIVDADLDGNPLSAVNDEERIANTEAADFCVKSEKMESFYLRKRPFFAEREVTAFAKKMNVHPGLVVGQLQRRMERYDLLRKHLVNVREYLASAMMMDGWGDVVPVN